MCEHWRHKAAISDTHTVNITSTVTFSRAQQREFASRFPVPLSRARVELFVTLRFAFADGVADADGAVAGALALEFAGLAGGLLARYWDIAIPIKTAAARIAVPTCKSRVRG
jgi:hypothetical protein